MSPPKMYEITACKDGRPVRDGATFLAGLALDDREAAADLLNRHLYGAALRDGGTRPELHRYHLQIRPVDSDGNGYGRPLIWRVPAAEGA